MRDHRQLLEGRLHIAVAVPESVAGDTGSINSEAAIIDELD